MKRKVLSFFLNDNTALDQRRGVFQIFGVHNPRERNATRKQFRMVDKVLEWWAKSNLHYEEILKADVCFMNIIFMQVWRDH